MTDGLRLDVSELETLRRAWRDAPDVVAEELARACAEGALLAEREIKERTPRGVTSALAGSISARPPRIDGASVSAAVSTSIAHAIPVELGTKPHFPPVAPIADWARYKLGVPADRAGSVAYLIARKIAARGTEGAFMFRDGAEAARPQVERFMSAAVGRVAERLAGARA